MSPWRENSLVLFARKLTCHVNSCQLKKNLKPLNCSSIKNGGVSRLTETDRNGPNGPERTYENTETDFYGYRNGPERTSVGTETDRNRLQLIPKRISVGTRKGRVGYDRNDPNKVMYVMVGRYSM